MSNIGLKNIRDYTGNFGDENQILGTEYDASSSEYKIKWVDGSGIGSGGSGGPSNTSVEPFNMSLSTRGTSLDDETGTYIHSSVFIANYTTYSKLKLYASDINVTTNDSIDIYILELTSGSIDVKLRYNYIFTQNVNQQDYEIDITLPSFSLSMNAKYNIGIHKNITTVGGKLYLIKNSLDNPLNNFNKLYNYDLTSTNDIGNLTDNQTQSDNFIFFWYRLSNLTNGPSQEPFTVSLSTLEDHDSNTYYAYSSFIAENENYTKIKLYINSESQIATGTSNKIHVRIIDSSNVLYMSGDVNITQSDVNSIININLISQLALTVNNKYLLGIYKEIQSPYDSITNTTGNKVRLYNNPYKNPFNGLFKLTDTSYSNIAINNNNTRYVKFYWYKLE